MRLLCSVDTGFNLGALSIPKHRSCLDYMNDMTGEYPDQSGGALENPNLNSSSFKAYDKYFGIPHRAIR